MDYMELQFPEDLRDQRVRSGQNISEAERWVSMAGGIGLIAYGINSAECSDLPSPLSAPAATLRLICATPCQVAILRITRRSLTPSARVSCPRYRWFHGHSPRAVRLEVGTPVVLSAGRDTHGGVDAL